VTLDRRQLQERIHELYRAEHEALGERGTLELLERGRAWDLAPTVADWAWSSFRTLGWPTAGIRSPRPCTAASTAAPAAWS
jgi:hypothetical protein